MRTDSSVYGDILAEYSDAIKLTRVLGILAMSYVHLHFFEHPVIDSQAFAYAKALLVDILGRSSVPLLSAISGFLIYGTILKYGYKSTIRSKASSLLLPMMGWNSVALILTGAIFAGTLSANLNGIFSFTDNSALIYLTFLRDLFVLALLTPLLIKAVSVCPLIVVLCVATVYVFDVSTILILRPQILMFYVIGLFIAIRPELVRMPSARRQNEILFICAIVLVMQLASVASPTVASVVSTVEFDLLVRRPAVATAFWVIAVRLAKSKQVGPLILASDAIFLFFLSHGVLFLIIGSVLSRFSAMQHAVIYFVAWLLAPLFSFGIVLISRRLLDVGCRHLSVRSRERAETRTS